MVQMKFCKQVATLDKKTTLEEFKKLIKKILSEFSKSLTDKHVLSQIVQEGRVLTGKDTSLMKAPEDLTERIVIEPLLDFLDYKDKYPRRTLSKGNIERE